MHTLTWEQINAWRLAQHSLTNRANRAQFLEVVARIGGLHAQLMSAAELQAWARVEDLTIEDVHNALWRAKTLIKSWVWRGTLHLAAASEYPLYTAALSTLKHFRRGSWQKYHQITGDELDALMAGVRDTLTDTGMTREALAAALADRMNLPKLRELLLSGWGALLKPSAFRGDIGFAASEGQNVTFIAPRQWLTIQWPEHDPQAALLTILRRFLAVYAPATMDEFARFTGLDDSIARKLFKTLAANDEIAGIKVDDWQAWILTDSLAAMQAAVPANVIRLLPYFDPYTLAVARHAHSLLPAEYHAKVYRAQGWISPVILHDGRIIGVWDTDTKRGTTQLTAALFTPATADLEAGIAAEAQRLGKFLQVSVVVMYTS